MSATIQHYRLKYPPRKYPNQGLGQRERVRNIVTVPNLRESDGLVNFLSVKRHAVYAQSSVLKAQDTLTSNG